MASPACMIKRLFDNQGVRFVFAGGVNTVISYAIFALMIFFGGHYFIANITMTIIGVTVSYILNKYFTFKQYQKSFVELLRFLSIYALSFILINVISYLSIDILQCNVYIAGVINIGFIAIISWFGHKYFSFKKDRSDSKCKK